MIAYTQRRDRGPAKWPAIITPKQQLVATFTRKTSSGRRVPRSYLLSGMLRCGNCGGKLFSALLGESRRYVCQAGPQQGGCGRMTIVAAPTEETPAARSRVLRKTETLALVSPPELPSYVAYSSRERG